MKTLYFKNGVTTEYPATIVLNSTAHLFLKNDGCAGINYPQLGGGYSVVKLFWNTENSLRPRLYWEELSRLREKGYRLGRINFTERLYD